MGEAAKDLRIACKIDFDEVADEWLKEVTPNAKKIEEHERNKQRRQEEKELKEKKAKIEKARKAREEAYKNSKENASNSSNGGMPKGMDGLGDLFSDPEVMKAFQDISTNPENISKYQNNPKVMKLVTQMMGQFGGGLPGGMGPGMGKFGGIGGMPGGFPGMASKPNTSNGDQKSNQTSTTDDLD